MKMTDTLFGHTNDEPVMEYTLVNDSGMSVSCLNYSCTITKILVPDRCGNIENVVLGFDQFFDYLDLSPYFGCVVGRAAGRIRNAEFTLDGESCQLTANEEPNHLHGGKKGFHSVIWKSEPIETESAVGLKFFYRSKDGEEGYPGNLDTTIIYLLNNQNELSITYEARTDQKTIVNLTNHSYFNLSGNLKRDCSEHVLQLDGDRFLELDSDLIPTGRLLEAANTPFDFKHGRLLKSGMKSSHPQNVLAGNGYDHHLVFSKKGENTVVLTDKESGRTLLMTTDQPCVVLYTANHLEGLYSISGVRARNYLGVCLETQGLPIDFNQPHFPATLLNPDEVYRSTTTYRFFSKTIGV
ncbi:aldose epimerase family protein [Neobacillus vireti]|uniref:aldose epimerase family protein n=1 Tax=Neobacillus vireti TaxID=220686 RepID=UPI002FFE9342